MNPPPPKVIEYKPPRRALCVSPGRNPLGFSVSVVEVHFVDNIMGEAQALVKDPRWEKAGIMPVPLKRIASTREKAMEKIAAHLETIFPDAAEPPSAAHSGSEDTASGIAGSPQPEPINT